MRTYLLAMLVAGLLACMCGCPQSGTATDQADNHAPVAATEESATNGQSPDTASSETTGPGDETPAATVDAEAQPEPETEADEPVSAKQITGTWLALFGRGDQGVNEQAYVNGHTLEFRPDGIVVLTLLNDSKPGQQLFGAYTIEHGRLEWTYTLAEAVDSGAVDYAPLGMGRDEEIGLLNKEQEGMGRDDEIGLMKGEKEGMGRDHEIGLNEGSDQGRPAMKHTEELRIVLDGPFMALTDDHGQIYVYGNASAASDGTLQQVDYQGSFEGKQLNATFTETAGKVEGRLGEYNGWFKGEAADGFIVGRIEGLPQLSLAALLPGPNGGLSGVLLSDPYVKLDPRFDFMPQK